MKKTKTKFDHNIYIEAAERISSEIEIYSCNAVFNLVSGSYLDPKHSERCKLADKYERFYQETFQLEPLCGLTPRNIDSKNYDDLKQFRILALLFMAEFVKDSNKKK